MGTIADKLNYLNTTKENIKSAIIAKGVSVSDSDTFRSYADKIADIEPTLGTKTITANGTYTASDDSLNGYSEVTVAIDDTDLYRDTTDSTYESVKTLSNCGAFPMSSLKVGIEPQQDLHGYDNPWVGGAGKNKLEFSLANCKSMTQNSGATWSGNVLSHAGVNFSVEEDGTVKTNGTASSNAILRYAYITPSVSGDYIINGLPQDGGDDTFEIMLVDGTFTLLIEPNSVASGTTVTLTAGTRYGIQIIFRNGYNSNGLTFKPMIRLSTETDATFAPYSNICPISGWDEANVSVCGKNWLPTGRGYDFPYNANIGTVLDVDTDAADWIDDKNGEYEVTLSDWQRCGLLSNQLPIGATTYLRIKIVSGSPKVTAYTLDTDYRVIRKFSNYNPASDGLDYNTQIQLAENEHYVGVAIVGSNKKVIIRTPHIVLNADEPYEPYNGQTYNIPFTDSQGRSVEVFGGSVDIVNGGGDADREKLMLADDVSWRKYGTYASGIRLITNEFDSIPNDLLMEKCMSNMLTFRTTWVEGENYLVFERGGSKTSLLLTTASTGLDANSSVDDVNAWLRTAGAYMIAPLATPTTFNTQPTAVKSLLGTNNIWADTGDVGDVRYFKKVEL